MSLKNNFNITITASNNEVRRIIFEKIYNFLSNEKDIGLVSHGVSSHRREAHISADYDGEIKNKGGAWDRGKWG